MRDRYKFEIKTARIAKSGIYKYSKAEAEAMTGETFDSPYVNIYRPAVVLANAVDKFKSVPLTLEHPSSFVTPENYQRLAIGAVMDSPKVSYVDGEVAIDNKIMLGSLQAYNALARGVKELSAGYVAKFKKAHGEYRGQAYDGIMTDIETVNHFAITKRARGGHQTRVLDSLKGDMKLKTGLFHRIYKAFVKDSKSFDELVDLIAKGEEKPDAIKGYIDTLPDNEDKLKLQRYLEDLSNATGALDDEVVAMGAKEIKELYHSMESELAKEEPETPQVPLQPDEEVSVVDPTEDSAEEPKEETKEEAKEEAKPEEKEEEKEEAPEEKPEEKTEENVEDGCGGQEEKPANDTSADMENKEEDKTAVSDSVASMAQGFTFDSMADEDKDKFKEFLIKAVYDSISDKDSELHKVIFGIPKKQGMKRFASPVVDSNDNKDTSAIAEYEKLKGAR